jgi:hypothetical protein
MGSLFGDSQYSMMVQKFAQSHRLLATVSANFRRLRQEDSNEDGHRTVSPTVSPTGKSELQSTDINELRRCMTRCTVQRRWEDRRAQQVART